MNERKLGYHYALKSPQYGNCRVLSPDGQLMFRCDKKKAFWYLNRNLGKKTNEEPLTIQLTFVPKGIGHIDDPYFLQEMQNRCVVCGSEDDLTRHHIVPYCYRKFFPDELKNHHSYDVMAMCIPCHHNYEKYAVKLKVVLAEKHSAPLNGTGAKYDKDMAKAKGAALALLKYPNISSTRREELIKKVATYIQKEPTCDDLNYLITKNPHDFDNYVHHGKLVMSKIEDINSFVQDWRKHFLASMFPKFLPPYWSIKR